MPRQTRLPLLPDGVAAEELGREVAEQISRAEEQGAVARPPEPGVHAEQLEVQQDERALEAHQAQDVEFGRDPDPEIIPRVELLVVLPYVQAHAVVRRDSHEHGVRDADEHAQRHDIYSIR